MVVVSGPRVEMRPVTSSRWRMERARTLRTKQSSPVTWWASMISGGVDDAVERLVEQAWAQGRIPGAVRLEGADLDPAVPVVTYCWGPGCNGATKAAAELTRRGYRVREMIGGVEYWIREGFPVRTDAGDKLGKPDSLTALDCGC